MGVLCCMCANLAFIAKVLICVSSIFCVTVVLVCKYLKRKYTTKVPIRPVVENGKYKSVNMKHLTKKDALPAGSSYLYDVIVVGGGPAGGVCSYYLGKSGVCVALIERKKYPRDKICGNAICVPSLRVLEDMGVLEELKKNDEILFADAGGFVSPSGLSYLGKSVFEIGEPLAGAVRRTDLDTRVALKAERAGADLFEDTEVETVSFEESDGIWKVETRGGVTFKARVLVCADGAHSATGRKLGLVTEAPKGVCTRATIKGGTHNANLDGLVLYPPKSLPGYCSIFRHTGDDIGFNFYLIPCGKEYGDALESDLPSLHKHALEKDPYISRLVGPRASIEPMKVAPLRVHGQGVKTTYANHVLLTGDAAGFIDPLTGEGIHNAMLSGREAAHTLCECFKNGDFSEKSLRQYKDRWTNQFGNDFEMSSKAVWLVWKFPILLDAAALNMQMFGDAPFAEWAKVMTMLEGKDLFLEPRIVFAIMYAVVRVILNKHLLSFWKKSYAYSYGSTWTRGA